MYLMPADGLDHLPSSQLSALNAHAYRFSLLSGLATITLLMLMAGCDSSPSPQTVDVDPTGGIETSAGESSGGMSGGGEVMGGVECTSDPSAEERCDQIDNDCDGEVDEDFDGLGAPCERRLMRCISEGILSCNAEGEMACDAPEINLSAEVCDQIDNDCDGEVDEGFSLLVDRDNCGACGQVCSWPNGIGRCEMGACLLTSCEMGYEDQNADPSDGCECNTSNDEACDGLDNDCDGVIDEGYSVTTACVVGEGACQVSGQLACVSDDTAACDATPGDPSPELCDLIDNDCDGVIDEDFDADGDGAAACELCEGCAMSGGDCPEQCQLNDCNDEDVAINPYVWDLCEDGIDQNCDGADAPCNEAYARATTLQIVSASDTPGTCPDQNGDGVGDNAFGQISGIANPSTADYIDRFNMNILVGAYQFDLTRPENRFNLSVLLGTYYRNSNPPAFLIRQTNFDITGRPNMRFPFAAVQGGILEGGPGTFVFNAPLQNANGESVVIEVPIEGAYIRGTFTLDPEDPTQFSLTNGLVSGYINKTSLQESFVLLDPPIVRVIESLITPDLDLNLDGEPDYYSICLLTTLSGVGVTIEEPEDNPPTP